LLSDQFHIQERAIPLAMTLGSIFKKKYLPDAGLL